MEGPLADLAADARGQALRRRRLVGGVVLVVAAGLLVLRCGLCDRQQDGALTSGMQLLWRGLEGDAAAFDEAEQALARAAGITTPYPLFVLEAARRLRERRWDDAAPPAQAVFAALAERRWDDAAAAARALPETLAGREQLTRLVSDLLAARLAARAASEP